MNLSTMTLRGKLILAFSVPMVVSVVMAIVIFFSVRGMIGASKWVDHTYRVIAEAKALSSAMIDMETGMRGFLVAGRDVFLEPYVAGERNFKNTITKLKVTVSDNPPQVARLEGIESLSTEWKANAAEQFIALRRQVGARSPISEITSLGTPDVSDGNVITMADVAAEIEKGAGKKYMDEIRARIDEFVGIEQKLIGVRTEEAESIASLTITLTIAGALISLVVVGFATLVITRDIRRQLGGEPSTMQSVSEQIARGDLTIRFDDDSPTGVYAAMRSMSQNLSDIVQKVLTASSSITHSAEEIAQGNLYLSERTEQQASSLEETAASMEELTATVRQNADNAKEARQLANTASQDADRGNEVVAKAVGAMSEINDSSRKIADIISMIDEIAFQTNLLALNAAVEAARAGEQGRGFAVVAQEVRLLAARSAEAASEISTLINESVSKVEEGTKLVNASGDVLDGILKGVKQLSSNVAEIAASSEEQYSGIEQVNSAIAQMDQVTQQKAALVEEAAAASQAMRQSAESLHQMMGFFKVSGAQQGLPRLAG